MRRSLYSNRVRSRGSLVPEGFVRMNTTKAKDGDGIRYSTVHSFNADDLKCCGFAPGNVVDIEVDETTSEGFLVVPKSRGRKLSGNAVVTLKSTWRPEDPFSLEPVMCKITALNKGEVCFEYPSSVVFEMHLPSKETKPTPAFKVMEAI